MDIEQIMQIDPFQALLLLVVGGGAVVAVDKLTGSAASLKERFVDGKAKRIVDAQLRGDAELREEILAMFEDSRADHDKYEKWFNRDNRRIVALEDAMEKVQEDIEKAHSRIDMHAEESTIIMKSMSVMMSRMLGLAEDSDIIDSVNEINDYLIERREK